MTATSQARTEQFVLACDDMVNTPCNTEDDILFSNVRVNAQRYLPWIERLDANDIPAVICGGGPSLKDCLPEIQQRVKLGQHIIAINGAAEFLSEHGVRPLCFMTIDARPENVKFVRSRPASFYLLSSTCAPEMFNELCGENVVLFHPNIDGILDHIPSRRSGTLIASTLTSGLTALNVAHVLGYRELHLYGFDSSDADSAHAYEQSETDAESKRIHVMLAGKKYVAQTAMYKQAMAFPEIASILAEAGAVISVHGDGLLPAMAREATQPANPSLACYDLGSAPASFDFIMWLVIAEMARRRYGAEGPLRVAFKSGPVDGFRSGDKALGHAPNQTQMLQHVLRPSLALVGAVEDESALNDGLWHNRYVPAPIVEAFRCGEEVPEFKAPLEYRGLVAEWLRANDINSSPVTITLREAEHWPQRNSNIAAWCKFAREIEDEFPIIFIRDTEKADDQLGDFLTCPQAAHDLLFRQALYEKAAANLFVANGPCTLAMFGNRPWLIFCPFHEGYAPSSDAWLRKHHGFGRGEQVPWAKPNQRFVWEADTYETIRDAWKSLNIGD